MKDLCCCGHIWEWHGGYLGDDCKDCDCDFFHIIGSRPDICLVCHEYIICSGFNLTRFECGREEIDVHDIPV